ncbi:hypothetical protein EJB05_54371, partial [Eragrostis curvula]
MADVAFGGVEKIVKVALAIQEAVETVKQNNKECRAIEKCATRCTALLQQLGEQDTMKGEAMRGPLEDMAESLEEALQLVKKCQRKNHFCCFTHLWEAGDMAKELGRVQDDILRKLQLGNFATTIQANITLINIQNTLTAPPQLTLPPPLTSEVSQLDERTDAMKGEAMRGPLEDVAESLEEALELVKLCQRKHDFSRLWKAGDMAKELRRARHDILRKIGVGNLAITIQTTTSTLTNVQNARAAPSPQSLPLLRSNEVASGFTRFSLSDLRTATDDFSAENIIGHGGTATVYKGVLDDGQEVAIKKIWHGLLRFKESSLYIEINVVLKLKHTNIIRPLGYCHEKVMVFGQYENEWVRAESNTFCFIEEYMPKGSMDSFLEGIIIQGITQGIHYLHEQRVIHLDLKPGNILLGPDMNPRISDFGLATMLKHVDDEITRGDSLSGTPAYMAPENIGEGILSIKSDVYAFGVILFQTISGMSRPKKSPNLQDSVAWAEVAQDAERMEELFGHTMVDQPQQMEDIKRCIGVGLLCMQSDRRKRPTMADVILMLSGEKEIPIPGKASA